MRERHCHIFLIKKWNSQMVQTLKQIGLVDLEIKSPHATSCYGQEYWLPPQKRYSKIGVHMMSLRPIS